MCQLTERDMLGPYHLSNAPFRTTVCERTPGDGTTPLSVEGYIKGNNCKGNTHIGFLNPPTEIVLMILL